MTNFPRACFYLSVDQPLSKAQSNMLKEREQQLIFSSSLSVILVSAVIIYLRVIASRRGCWGRLTHCSIIG